MNVITVSVCSCLGVNDVAHVLCLFVCIVLPGEVNKVAH